MFKKLISNLPFCPSLIDQLAVYSKQLKRESHIRGLGLALLMGAVLVQLASSNTLTSPPTAHAHTQQVLGVSTTSTETTGQSPAASSKPKYYTTRKTGLAVSSVFIVAVAFFYSRSRLLAKELEIVKDNFTSSGA